MRKSIIAVVLLLTAGYFLFAGGEDAEQEIRSRLEQGRTVAEVNEGEDPFKQASKAKELSQLFVERPSFDFTKAGYGKIVIENRKELSQKMLAIRAALSKLELSADDVRISVKDSQAQMTVRGSALGSLKGEEGEFLEIHTIDVLWQEREGAWLVKSVRHLRNERE